MLIFTSASKELPMRFELRMTRDVCTPAAIRCEAYSAIKSQSDERLSWV